MKRPYVPMKVKLQVLERQAFEEREYTSVIDREACREWFELATANFTTIGKIRWLVRYLFHGKPAELDHDPALVLRRRNKRTGGYIPDANNPRYLVYRLKPDHLRKTVGRSPGAERTVTSKGSDIWWAKKFRKLESPKKTRSRKIPSRPFSKQKRTMRA